MHLKDQYEIWIIKSRTDVVFDFGAIKGSMIKILDTITGDR